MSPYVIEEGIVYFASDFMRQMIGDVLKTETIRIDNNTVRDISYEFDIELGEYTETSHSDREDVLPPIPPTPEQIEIAELRGQLAQTNADLAAVLEMILG